MSAIGQDPAPDPGTSGGNEPEGTPFDFERAYGQLQPEYTRSRQELSTTRERLSEYEQLFDALHDSDPEVQQQAMAALGLEMDTGSHGTPVPEDEFIDPLEEEVRELRAWRDEVQSARELEATEKQAQELTGMRDEYIGEAITYIEDSLKPQYGKDFKFSEREEEVLGNLAIAMADEDDIPDVQGAYNALYGTDGMLEINRERWYANKTGAVKPPSGVSIPAEDEAPKTPRGRAKLMDARLAALDAQR